MSSQLGASKRFDEAFLYFEKHINNCPFSQTAFYNYAGILYQSAGKSASSRATKTIEALVLLNDCVRLDENAERCLDLRRQMDPEGKTYKKATGLFDSQPTTDHHARAAASRKAKAESPSASPLSVEDSLLEDESEAITLEDDELDML